MTTFSIKVQGGDELASRMRKFGNSVLDLSDSMEQIGNYFDDFFSGQVFASRGQVIGEPWARLDDSYAAWKARKFPGRPPLIRTGLMQRSFKHRSTRLSVSLMNEADYFDFVNDGTRNMPARVMMKIDQARESRIISFVEEDLNSKQRAADV